MFQCTARVPNRRTIGFEIFGENITTADINCTTNSFIRTCNRVIDSHLVSLTCDYSTGYQINCTLSVDNVTRSSEVFCRVLNQSVEAMERAAVLVVDGMESSKGLVTWKFYFEHDRVFRRVNIMLPITSIMHIQVPIHTSVLAIPLP